MMDLLLLYSKESLIDFAFSREALPYETVFARATTGQRCNSAGVFESVAAGAPRFDYDPATGTLRGLLYEVQRTNAIPNNTMDGAINGTPGALPTRWVDGVPAGCTRTITTGIEKGLPYVDVRIFGTVSSSSSSRFISFASSVEIAAKQGETWTCSVYLKLVAGSFVNISNLGVSVAEFSSSAVWQAGGSSAISPTSTFTRYTHTRTLANVNTAYVQPTIGYYVTAGTSVDFTLRIYAPQLEKGSAATSPIFTSGVSATRAADVLSFGVPTDISVLRYVFDDESVQEVAVSAGAYTVPTNLNRSRIKRIIGK